MLLHRVSGVLRFLCSVSGVLRPLYCVSGVFRSSYSPRRARRLLAKPWQPRTERSRAPNPHEGFGKVRTVESTRTPQLRTTKSTTLLPPLRKSLMRNHTFYIHDSRKCFYKRLPQASAKRLQARRPRHPSSFESRSGSSVSIAGSGTTLLRPLPGEGSSRSLRAGSDSCLKAFSGQL